MLVCVCERERKRTRRPHFFACTKPGYVFLSRFLSHLRTSPFPYKDPYRHLAKLFFVLFFCQIYAPLLSRIRTHIVTLLKYFFVQFFFGKFPLTHLSLTFPSDDTRNEALIERGKMDKPLISQKKGGRGRMYYLKEMKKE